MDQPPSLPNFLLRGIIGLAVAALAALLSWASYEGARTKGGQYILWWGGVVWGLWFGLRNLYAHSKLCAALRELNRGVFESLEPQRPGSDRMIVAAAFTQLGLGLAAADGPTSDSEIEAIINFFVRHEADDEFLASIRSLLGRFAARPEVEAAIDALQRVAGHEEAQTYVVAGLHEVAVADGAINEIETSVLVGLMMRLGFTKEKAVAILAALNRVQQGEDELARALRALELDDNATEDEIRNAHRRLVQRYHPDKVSHLGPEFGRLAAQRFQEIQAAYETLCKTTDGGAVQGD